MKRRFIITAVLASLVSCSATYGDGLALMKIEQGARPAAMGGAFVGVPSDVVSSMYNPAGAVDINQFTATFGHTSYWENIRLESGFFAMNLSSRSFIHGGIRFAVVDELEGRLAPSSEFESFQAHDISFKGGFAYRISPRLAAGGAMGWFIEKIDAWRGSAFNIDLGLLYQASENTNIGASVVNLGGDFSLSKSGFTGSRDISLPTTYRAGAAYSFRDYLGTADIVVVDDEFHLHVGAEAAIQKVFRLRAGYMLNYDSKNIAAGAAFSKRNLTVDYAFVPYSNDLGSSHLFNLTFSL